MTDKHILLLESPSGANDEIQIRLGSFFEQILASMFRHALRLSGNRATVSPSNPIELKLSGPHSKSRKYHGLVKDQGAMIIFRTGCIG